MTDAAPTGHQINKIGISSRHGMLQDQGYHWPVQEREVFELYYLVGFDADEIAMIQSCAPNEIEVLIGKIQLQLRDFLRETAH